MVIHEIYVIILISVDNCIQREKEGNVYFLSFTNLYYWQKEHDILNWLVLMSCSSIKRQQ